MSDVFHEAEKYAEDHPEQVDKGIEAAAREAEKRTGDRYDKEIDKGVSEIEQRLGKDGKQRSDG